MHIAANPHRLGSVDVACELSVIGPLFLLSFPPSVCAKGPIYYLIGASSRMVSSTQPLPTKTSICFLDVRSLILVGALELSTNPTPQGYVCIKL